MSVPASNFLTRYSKMLILVNNFAKDHFLTESVRVPHIFNRSLHNQSLILTNHSTASPSFWQIFQQPVPHFDKSFNNRSLILTDHLTISPSFYRSFSNVWQWSNYLFYYFILSWVFLQFIPPSITPYIPSPISLSFPLIIQQRQIIGRRLKKKKIKTFKCKYIWDQIQQRALVF